MVRTVTQHHSAGKPIQPRAEQGLYVCVRFNGSGGLEKLNSNEPAKSSIAISAFCCKPL